MRRSLGRGVLGDVGLASDAASTGDVLVEVVSDKKRRVKDCDAAAVMVVGRTKARECGRCEARVAQNRSMAAVARRREMVLIATREAKCVFSLLEKIWQ